MRADTGPARQAVSPFISYRATSRESARTEPIDIFETCGLLFGVRGSIFDVGRSTFGVCGSTFGRLHLDVQSRYSTCLKIATHTPKHAQCRALDTL
jgi:hypothetical protein